jgi:hypothetical protein
MPWLYRKHILRQSMRSALPEAVTERPKQILGALASSLIEQADFSGFAPGNALLKYVDMVALRKATVEKDNPTMDTMALRPLILDHWLQQR